MLGEGHLYDIIVFMKPLQKFAHRVLDLKEIDHIVPLHIHVNIGPDSDLVHPVYFIVGSRQHAQNILSLDFISDLIKHSDSQCSSRLSDDMLVIKEFNNRLANLAFAYQLDGYFILFEYVLIKNFTKAIRPGVGTEAPSMNVSTFQSYVYSPDYKDLYMEGQPRGSHPITFVFGLN